MKWLYLLLDLGTLFFPLVLSFDKNVHFVKHWKNVFLSSFLIAIPFILWDMYFTKEGIWGFNEDYLTGINIANLPLEEVLFFFVVPFACTFIYECCKFYLNRFSFKVFNQVLVVLILLYAGTLFAINPLAEYTFWVFLATLIVLFIWAINLKLKFIGISYLLSLIPFLLMNGALTGLFTKNPVVWYNDQQNINIRLLSIPLEDVIYSFSLIVGTIITFEYLNKRNEKNRASL